MRENCELMTRYLFLSLSKSRQSSCDSSRVEFFRSKSLYAFFVRIIILTVIDELSGGGRNFYEVF